MYLNILVYFYFFDNPFQVSKLILNNNVPAVRYIHEAYKCADCTFLAVPQSLRDSTGVILRHAAGNVSFAPPGQ